VIVPRKPLPRCATSATSRDTFLVIVRTLLLAEATHTAEEAEAAEEEARSATSAARPVISRVHARRTLEVEVAVVDEAVLAAVAAAEAMLPRPVTHVEVRDTCREIVFKGASVTTATEWVTCRRTAHNHKRRPAITVGRKVISLVIALVPLRLERPPAFIPDL